MRRREVREAWQSGSASFDLVARLCALGGRPSSGPSVPSACDWTEFTQLISRHRVAGIVYAAIGSTAGVVPAEIREWLAKGSRDLAFQNYAMAVETARLQRLFDEAGLRAVMFKGVTLSCRAYGSLLIKQGKDIDFLVARRDLPRCIELLEADTYRLSSPRSTLTSAQWRSATRYEMQVEMIHSGTRFQIEPHWQLTENRKLLSADRLMTLAGDHGDRVFGTRIRTFHPDDLFAYLCVHGARSGWFRLKSLADLHALIAKASPAEVERLYDHAQGLGVGPCAAVALSMCNVVFGREIPATIDAQVETRWSLRMMRALFLDNMLQPGPLLSAIRGLAGHLLLAASHKYLLSEIGRWAINPADTIALPLPRHFHFMYVLLRAPLFLWRRPMRARQLRPS